MSLNSEDSKTITSFEMKPKFWDDDMKMEAWFAPFRNRDLNPLNYDNKMAFWKDNIEIFCNNTHRGYFTINQLKKFFVRNGKQPACLIHVLENMLREGTVQTLAEYESSLSNNTWVGWAVNKLVSSPLKWSFRKVVDVVSPTVVEIDENTEYVHFPSFKNQSENLYKIVKNNKDEMFTYEKIKEIYSDKLGFTVELKMIKLLVHWLEIDGKACIYFENKHCHTHLIKFKTDQHIPKISETEVSVYILQQKEQSVMDKLQKLEAEKERMQSEVRNFLKQKMRNLAKNTLRKQKEVEKRITKMMNVLENIQSLLYKVQDTEADAQILESYKVGTNALKNRINKAGLNLDNVDHAMDEIEKALDLHNDIQETLGQVVGIQNETELEDELAELLLNDVPTIPPEPPSGSPGRKVKGNEDSFSYEDLPEVPEAHLSSEVKVELRRVQF